MCGIVGYIGNKQASPILLRGLKRLEYRGYDSAGVAIRDDEGIRQVRRVGRVQSLSTALQSDPLKGTIGISHTRWATHGGVSEHNAHPHISSDGKFSLVHNGVIENFSSMKHFLEDKGYSFSSETDSEALVNLIAYHYAKEPENGSGESRFLRSVRKALLHVEGTYGIAVICIDYPDVMIGARLGSPLIVGLGKDENFIASDVGALVGATLNVIYLNDGELVELSRDNYQVITADEELVDAIIHQVDWEVEDSEKGDFRHFMLKEIFEQPRALENAMRGRFSKDESSAKFGGLNIDVRELRQVERIVFCGCGTAWHACLIAEYLIEKYARIPVEVEYASEFRYRNAPLDRDTLIFVVSQSGETIDTLAALREAKRKGYRTLAINNVVGSTIAREADGGIYQHAGPEIGVASTKAFTSQLVLVSMVALYFGRIRDLSFSAGRNFVQSLRELPSKVEETLKLNDQIKSVAEKYAQHEDCLFLGRQLMFPVALEGALKLKEISYIHAEGYPAAEMKHGPIALISEGCPSVFLVEGGEIFQKTIANMQEVKARKGKVIAIATEDCDIPDGLVDDLIVVPSATDPALPIIMSVPLQLLSYHIAVARDCDVDKPRNLAKSVTVE
ncbi:MAG: glutamine--fructose-6-phosphate transaminase (isomerizing) [Verrucomicrobiota bacterium]